MANASRTTRSLSLDKSIVLEIERTKGTVSTSQRVNELVRAALAAERREALHQEVAAFFAQRPADDDMDVHDAFHAAAISSLIAEGDG